ncbi:MAG: hypothetical protein ACRBBJ_08895 [Rhodomicrobiaceae bacterium]
MAGTTTADFLKWERKAQVSFLQISISMAGILLAQTKPKIARCIDRWYFKNEDTKKKQNAFILKEMLKYKAYHPNAVIIGFIEQECGSIGNEN